MYNLQPLCVMSDNANMGPPLKRLLQLAVWSGLRLHGYFRHGYDADPMGIGATGVCGTGQQDQARQQEQVFLQCVFG